MKNLVQRASRLGLAVLVVGGLGLSSCHKDDSTTVYGNWTKASSYAGSTRRGSVAFVINGIAYVGTGIDQNGQKLSDFYSFSPTAGWIKLTNMPGQARYSAVAFSANNKGYVGTGLGDNNGNLADFYEFDPSGTTTTTTTVNGVSTTVTTSGSWRRVADMPVNAGTTGRYGAVATSISNVGYVGCGFDGNSEKDFYMFTPPSSSTSTGTWATVNGFPGDKRVNGAVFTIGNVMYVGTGTNNGANVTDFSAYDASAKTWTVKRNLANQTTGSDIYDYSAVARTQGVGFAIGNYGYLATGSSRQDCYQYDPSADTWTKMNPYLGASRNNAVAFTIGNYSYVGLGANSSTSPFDDFYQFDPTITQQ